MALWTAESLARIHNASIHLIQAVLWQPELEGAKRGFLATVSTQAATHQRQEGRHLLEDRLLPHSVPQAPQLPPLSCPATSASRQHRICGPWRHSLVSSSHPSPGRPDPPSQPPPMSLFRISSALALHHDAPGRSATVCCDQGPASLSTTGKISGLDRPPLTSGTS